jgi:predicted DNA binding protein
MGFVLEAGLSHDELVLIPAINAVSGTTLRCEYAASAGETVFISTLGADSGAVERALEADRTVSKPTRLGTFSNRTVYGVRNRSGLTIVSPACVEAGAFVIEITSGIERWLVRVYLPDRAALTAFREDCRDRGVSFRVHQLRESGSGDDATYFLTDQQHEILLLAYYAGYYDIPRRVSQGDLAD